MNDSYYYELLKEDKMLTGIYISFYYHEWLETTRRLNVDWILHIVKTLIRGNDSYYHEMLEED